MELEFHNFRSVDVHSYAHKRRKIREEFEKLKNAEIEKVDNTLEKYEFFMEYTYQINPLTCMLKI